VMVDTLLSLKISVLYMNVFHAIVWKCDNTTNIQSHFFVLAGVTTLEVDGIVHILKHHKGHMYH